MGMSESVGVDVDGFFLSHSVLFLHPYPNIHTHTFNLSFDEISYGTKTPNYDRTISSTVILTHTIKFRLEKVCSDAQFILIVGAGSIAPT